MFGTYMNHKGLVPVSNFEVKYKLFLKSVAVRLNLL